VILAGKGTHIALMQFWDQSEPRGIRVGVGTGDGVSVGGSGVEVESPAGTVSVGWTVGATVSV
jgi:hypothetical protein